MKIYLVISIDPTPEGESSDTQIIKAFRNRVDAMNFIAQCSSEMKKWNDAFPDTGDYEKDREIQNAYLETNPFQKDGHYPDSFEMVIIDLE